MEVIGRTLWVVALFGLVGCGDDEKDPPPGGGGLCNEGPVACEDEIILDLNLQASAAPGDATSTYGTYWTSLVDGTAGGFNANPPHSYVYFRFGDSGLEKANLSDEQALVSTDWDIAFRRYVVRINSGNSGPSCVSAARVVGVTFEDLVDVPANAVFHKDEFYTPDCTLEGDGSGLQGSPSTALSGFWSYPGCVQMTGNVYIVELAAGRHVKLEVLRYYNQTAQDECQTTDSVTTSPSGSGSYEIRWDFID